jgi:TolA-binding protein
VYPDPTVVELVTGRFVPVRVHAREQRDEFKRLSEKYDAPWTPTTLILDSGGVERHRIEGFLPVRDYLSQVELGAAKAAFARKDYEKAESLFRGVVRDYADTDAGPEAHYWAGVSRYRATNDPQALADTAKAFRERFQDSTWAKKASVWGG